jgi:hypothetical protein
VGVPSPGLDMGALGDGMTGSCTVLATMETCRASCHLSYHQVGCEGRSNPSSVSHPT